jgi:hypothetical protein
MCFHDYVSIASTLNLKFYRVVRFLINILKPHLNLRFDKCEILEKTSS